MNDEQKWYYRLTNINDSDDTLLVSSEMPVKPEKLCEIFRLKGFTAEFISKEEFGEDEIEFPTEEE